MGSDPAAAMVISALYGGAGHGMSGLDLSRMTGLRPGRVYPVLVRLCRAGLIEAHWQGDGRRRYALAAPGAVTVRPAGVCPAAAAEGTPVTATATPATATVVPATATVTPATVTAIPATVTAIPATAARAARTLVRSPGFWWLSVAAVAAVDAYAALSRPADERLTDLAVYTGAVSGWRSGASLYAFAAPDGAPFTYPPFAGMVLRPLAYLAEVPAQVAWTLATIGTVIAVAALVARRLDRRPTCRATTAAWQAPAVATALLLSTPVSSNLRFGQVSVVLGALVLADTLLLRGRRYHGTLIGIAAALKLTPLIFIPMLWLAGQRRAAAVAVTTFGAGGALAWLVLPGDSRLFFRDLVWHAGRLGHITTGGNQSVNGALLRLSVAGPARTFAVLALATVVGVAALSRAARLARCGAWLSATTIVGSASVAVSPVSWTHHQVWLVLAALLPVAGSTRRRYAWAGLVLAVMILPVTALTPLVCGEARMLLAVAVAALVPLSVGEATRPDEVWIVSTGRRPGPGPLPAIRSIAANDRHPGVTDIRG